MRQLLIFLQAIFLLTIHFAHAETKQLKLQNPDGTPAGDAQAVAIMTLGARVDENLKELPSLVAVLSEPGTAAAKNAAGTITFDSKAKAIVAQNEIGFAFFPLKHNVTTVKLRPWAAFKIDTSKVSKDQLKSKRFSVVWTNCFAGNAPRPDSNDPFGADPFKSSEPSLDWRFDQIVTWSRTYDNPKASIENPDASIKVPPGEVSVVFGGEGFEAVDAQNPIPSVIFNPVRTTSKTLTTFELPNFGSAAGKIAPHSDLPDWNNEGGIRYLRASRFNEYPAQVPAELENAFIKFDLNSLASLYASEKGKQFRSLSLPEIICQVNSDDSFRFEGIPEGTYSLEIIALTGPVSMKYKADTENKPLKFLVKAGGSTTIEEADLLLLTNLAASNMPNPIATADGGQFSIRNPGPVAESSKQVDPFEGSLSLGERDPFANSSSTPTPDAGKAVIDAAVKKAEMKITMALLKASADIDYQGTPLRQVMQELQDTFNIPIRLNTIPISSELNVDSEVPVTISLPSMTARSALRHILSSVSEELTFTIRDEVLLITTKSDAAKSEGEFLSPKPVVQRPSESPATEQLDTGKTFVDQWLKSSQNDSSPQALSKALQTHLEQEFDSNQKSRKAELERLRALLKQSEDWVNTRQTRRAEIVRKGLAELLDQIKPASALRR